MLLGYVVQLWSDRRFSFSCSAGMQMQKPKKTMRLGGGCCEIGPRRKLRAVGALSAGGPDSNSSPLSPHLSLVCTPLPWCQNPAPDVLPERGRPTRHDGRVQAQELPVWRRTGVGIDDVMPFEKNSWRPGCRRGGGVCAVPGASVLGVASVFSRLRSASRPKRRRARPSSHQRARATASPKNIPIEPCLTSRGLLKVPTMCRLVVRWSSFPTCAG